MFTPSRASTVTCSGSRKTTASFLRAPSLLKQESPAEDWNHRGNRQQKS